MKISLKTLATCGVVALCVSTAWSQSPRDFRPDERLSYKTKLALQAENAPWQREQKAIVASASKSSNVLPLWNNDLQDVAVYARINAPESRQAGILVRLKTTADGGASGYLVALQNGELTFSKLTLDSTGRELSRTPLPAPPPALARFVPPGGEGQDALPTIPGIHPPAGQTPARLVAPVIAPGSSPETATQPADAPKMWLPEPAPERPLQAWNELNFLIDVNLLRASINYGKNASGVSDDAGQSYGAVALYVGPGEGEVRFKDIAYKNLALQTIPSEQVSHRFTLRQLDEFYHGWSAAAADINRDGHMDVVAGPYYYQGPTFEQRREIYVANTYNPGRQFAPNMITFAEDVTGDGWPDVLATEGRQIVLYVNPRGVARRWQRHVIAPGVWSEFAVFSDIDNEPGSELVFMRLDGTVVFAKPAAAHPTEPWPVFEVSGPKQGKFHGLGAGDINGDGRVDIVQPNGWWQQPDKGATSQRWRFHAYAFDAGERHGEGGAHMAVADLNGDGLADIAASHNAHGFGLAWFEQQRSSTGEITFERHQIMGDFRDNNPGGLTVAALHSGARIADFDRDGVPDIVTGKRFWAHLDSHADPDKDGPAYLLLYRGEHDRKAPGGIRFSPEVIHNRSGVGSDFTLADMNADGVVDIVTSATRGTFVFLTQIHCKREVKAWSTVAISC